MGRFLFDIILTFYTPYLLGLSLLQIILPKAIGMRSKALSAMRFHQM